MKWIFKWLLRLFIATVALAVVAIVVLLLSYNWILREVIVHQIRAQTGMDAEIGTFKLALTSPTLEIQNFTLYNPPKFGGTPFLNIPEIHVEYDPAALARQEIHLTLMRFNLGELDIVKNQAGQTNIFMPIAGVPSPKSGGGNALASFKKQSGFDFTGIDVLNVSVGTVKYIDLGNQNNNREQTIGIEDCIIKHVKSLDDLMGLEALIGLRSNGFFDFLIKKPKNPGLNFLLELGL